MFAVVTCYLGTIVHWGLFMGLMEKKMEATIMGYIGVIITPI